MNARIAGSVTNSLFSASVDGDPSQSTTLAPLVGPESGNLVLPRGVINAKVEGKIDNSSIHSLVTDPNQAFYAKEVHLTHGPVIPPVVPYAPSGRRRSITRARIRLKGLFKIDHRPRIDRPNEAEKK